MLDATSVPWVPPSLALSASNDPEIKYQARATQKGSKGLQALYWDIVGKMTLKPKPSNMHMNILVFMTLADRHPGVLKWTLESRFRVLGLGFQVLGSGFGVASISST